MSGTNEPAREPKWVDQTQVIQNQINECKEIASLIRINAGFILKADVPAETKDPACAEVEGSVEERRTIDSSALSIRLNELQESLRNLSGDLGNLKDLIDV